MNIQSINEALGILHYDTKLESDILVLSLECLGSTIQQKSVRFRVAGCENTDNKDSFLAELYKYLSFRLTEIFKRLELINWMREKIIESIADNVSEDWLLYGSLIIKDFHIDIISLLDSVAPVIIESAIGLKSKDRVKLPGFPDIKKRSKRSYRKKLPDNLKALIDLTESWESDVKKIRDILMHRDHMHTVFGKPQEGIFFQIYSPGLLDPQLLDPAVLRENSKNVVDFRLYSADIVSEIIVFLDKLGSR